MGNPHSRPEDRLRYITREVNSLRSSLKTSKQNISKDKKEFLVQNLVLQSSEVSSLNGKVKRKNIDETLKNISEIMQEILKIEPVELDGGAVESDSFVNMPLNRRSNSLGSLRSSRKTLREPAIVNRSSVPTLRDIDAKVTELKTQIATAINNKDSKQLRVYQQTIRVLAAELEMIHIEKDTPLETRKEGLDKKIITLYHKIGKALNELKRDANLRNPSKQHKKEKAMDELAEIEVNLTENESLLDKLIKEKSSSGFVTIRNNIVENNQKLTKVDIVDNDVKEKVVLLSQKLSETVKTLDRVMAKREFDSKFTKSLGTYERIVRNFDSTNPEDTMNHLQNLRNSIEHIEDLNDTAKNRKKELLNNINYQIQNINEVIQKQSDQKIIEKIVEDNVILRKKVKSSDKEHTVIDQFINYWKNVKSNFDVNSYSNLSLLRIDGVLEEMQQSINDIRIGIANKCDLNPPANLSKKHSQSVPKLNPRKSYGSNRSLDELDGKVIKTKAKMYNISTPELQNVNEKQQQNYVNHRFSKIEEIKLQVHYIKEKIDDSHNKKLLRDKLEQYMRNLQEYVNDPNKTVQNNAMLVSNEIIELLHELVLADTKERIDVLSKKVHNFNGTRYHKEFDEIKDDLIKTQLNLENFNIPAQFELLVQEKGEMLDELVNCIEQLQEKAFSSRKYEDGNVKQFKAKLQTLNGQVKRFSGTYKGVLYNNIERDLNKLLLDVSEKVEDKIWSDEITKETERLLKILEQRSSLAQSFRVNKPEENKSEEQIGIIKIKRDLFNIKKEIDRTPENNVDAFIGLQSRLDLVNLELGQIVARSNENLAKEKDIFTNEAQTLRNVVDAKIALGQQPMVNWPERELQPDSTTYPNPDLNKEIAQFEAAFGAIKRDITAPNNEQDVHKYYKLSQDIKSLIEKLQNYRLIRGTDLHTRQTTLLNEMQYYVKGLEQGAVDVDYVLNMERKMENLENLVHSGQQHDLKTMAEELQAIQKRLQDHRFTTTNENLRIRKTSVQQRTDGLAQKLKELETNENKQLTEEIKKINDIEDKMDNLASTVTSFIGLKTENKYYELNETIIRTILILDKINTENAELQKRRLKLLKDLHTLCQVLDQRVQQTQEIISLEQGLDEISSMLDNFSDTEDEFNSIKSKMEALRSSLQGLKVGNDLVSRKNACVERFSVLFNRTLTLGAGIVSTQTSSSHTAVTQQISSGYTTQVYNFVSKSPHAVTKDINGNEDILIQIDKNVANVEQAVNSTQDINQLQRFDETLTQYTIQIGKLNYSKDSPQYPKVFELYQRIENLADVIEEKLQENDKLLASIQEVDEISNKINTPLSYDEINRLDERLIQLQVTLGKMSHEGIKAQIDGCMLRIILCLQKISEYRASVQGTAV